MATNENKVQFNIKNVHYAVMTADGETPTWENPVPVPGAVNLSLEASGEITPFYADGVVYYKSSSNNGYEGDLEMARFIDKMLQDVWGYVLNATDKTIIENVGVEPKSFALLSKSTATPTTTCTACTTARARARALSARRVRTPRSRRRRPARSLRRLSKTATSLHVRPVRRRRAFARHGLQRSIRLPPEKGKEYGEKNSD